MKSKVFSFSIIFLIVFLLLICNLGQSFKSDIFSYDDTMIHYSSLQSSWNNASSYEDYINKSSDYIINTLKNYNVKPIAGKDYTSSGTIYVPEYDYPSSLEVISAYGKTIKSYSYDSDFIEDLRGNIISGYVKSKPTVIEKYYSDPKVLNEIILLDTYGNSEYNFIKNADENLKYYGAAAVITPAQTENLKSESGLNDILSPSDKNGLVKFIVTKKVYQELKSYSNKGYTIRMKSGAIIKQSNIKNICGFIKGKYSYYKPLVYVCFYDSKYKNKIDKSQNIDKYLFTPSLMLETIRSMHFQRTKPLRDIIFLFLSGYPQNKLSLDNINQFTSSNNIIFLDLFGTTHDINILSNSNYALSKSVKEAADMNSFNVVSNILNKNKKYIDISSSPDYKYNTDNFQLLFRANKFILSIINDECYNIDYLSDRFAFVKSAKKFIKSNSAIISILTMILMIMIVFQKHRPVKDNH